MTSSATDSRMTSLLLGLTVLTGMVDAVSYLRLGHIFVANMTGNVVFLGFALAGSGGFDPVASVVAIVAFLAGARLATLLLARAAGDRMRMLAFVATLETAFLLAGTALVLLLPVTEDDPARYVLSFVLAVAMGAQSAVAKKLAVADVSTTVVTMTLASLGAGGPGSRRRIGAVVAMGAGAVIGAALVLHLGSAAALRSATALALAAVVGGGVAAAAWRSVAQAPVTARS